MLAVYEEQKVERDEGNAEYYKRLAREELEQAERTSDPKTVAAHFEQAQRYLDKLWRLKKRGPWRTRN